MKRVPELAACLLIVLALFLGACARRPALSAAAAPAPTETRATIPAPAPAPPAPAPAAAPEPAPTPAPVQPVATPAPPPAPQEFAAHEAVKRIHFDFDKWDIRPGDAKILDANAAWLKQNDTYLLLIEGHCDERGTNEYNLALGDKRAKAAMNYLAAQGVKADRMTTVSYGEERPLCNGRTEECWQQNRRDQFLVKPR